MRDYLQMMGDQADDSPAPRPMPMGQPAQQGGPMGRPILAPKRVTQDNGPNPMRRGWNGWQEQPGNEPNPIGGGGPMPIPEGGPNWRGTTGGFDPVGGGGAMGFDPLGGAGGAMGLGSPGGPQQEGGPNWRGNPKGVGMNMPNGKGPGGWFDFNPPGDIAGRGVPTGGFDPVGPGGGLGGPQPWGDGQTMTATGDNGWVHGPDGLRYRRSDSNGSGAGGPMPIPDRDGGGFGGAGGPMPRGPNPRPYAPPPGAVPMDRGPGLPQSYYLQNHPNNPNSKFAQWKASQQQGPMAPPPGNTGIVPPHMQDGRGNGGPRILGGPGSPPHPQNGPAVPGAPPQHWQRAAGQNPQDQMDFMNKLKSAHNGGFQWRKP